MVSGSVHHFGPFRLDPGSRLLTRDGIALPLAPRTFDLLIVLVTSNGRLLSKNELLRVIWGDVNVEEASLSFQISTLRKALGENGTAWIETVPKHGFRFTAEVKTAVVVEPLLELEGSRGTASPASEPERKPAAIWIVSRRSALWAGAFLLLAAAMTGVWVIRAHSTGPRPEASLNVRPLTSYPGQEIQPSLSPDGTRVAFAWNGERKNNWDIYIQLVGQGTPVPLTADPRPEFSPAWSPDGRMIAFCRQVDELQQDVKGRSAGEIVVVPAGGGPERVIARASESWTPLGDLRFQVLNWFPSSDALVAVGYPVGGPRVSPADPGVSPYAIYVIPLDGGDARRITSPAELAWGDGLPAVSPDGRYLAFTRSLSQAWVFAEVYVAPLGAGKGPVGTPEPLTQIEPRPITEQNDGAVSAVVWGPSANEVLFARRGGMWRVPVVGRHVPKPVPTPGYRPGRFSVSRDGARLVFSSGSWDMDIWRVPGPENKHTKGTPAQGESLIATTKLESNAQYSPDGKRIAFTSLRSGRTQIWVSDSDGSNQIQITHSEAWNGTPRWSPDGRYIAYDSVERAKADIYVVPTAGGAAIRITPEESHEDVPGWSRDGRWVYYESDRSGGFQLWKTEFPSGRTVQVTSNGGVAAFEPLDAPWVYYAKRQRGGIWRKPVGGGEEELVIDHGHAYFWGLYNQGVCLLNPLRPVVTIECMPFGSKGPATIAAFPNDGHVSRPAGPSFGISPDGSWILYSRVEREESDLMLIDNMGLPPK